MKSDEEQQLIREILAGDETAKTRLYQEFRPLLYRVAVHCLGFQDSEIEDTIQETFLAAYQNLARFEGRSSLYTWLSHICANQCFLRLRHRKKTLATQHEDLELALAPRAEAEARRKNQENQTEARLLILREKLGQLTAPCREIVLLRDVEGTDYVAIGKKLKLPLGTVMSRLSRCREALRVLVMASSKETRS